MTLTALLAALIFTTGCATKPPPDPKQPRCVLPLLPDWPLVQWEEINPEARESVEAYMAVTIDSLNEHREMLRSICTPPM